MTEQVNHYKGYHISICMKRENIEKVELVTASKVDRCGNLVDIIFIPGIPKGRNKYIDFASRKNAYECAKKMIDKRQKKYTGKAGRK